MNAERPLRFSAHERDVARLLSDTQVQFFDWLEAHPEGLERSSFSTLHAPAPFRPGGLQSWPLFLGPEFREKMATACRSIFRAVRRAPRREFAGNPDALARYYGDAAGAEIILKTLEATSDAEDAIGRADLILTAEGWRCLEYNFQGARLGGWASVLSGYAMRDVPLVAQFAKSRSLELVPSHPLRAFLEYAIGRCADVDASELNIAIALEEAVETSPSADMQLAFVNAEWTTTLETHRPGLRGSVAICGVSELARRGGRCYLGDKQVHIILEWIVTRDLVVDAFLLDTITDGSTVIFNGPATEVLSDKRTLALVHDQLSRGEFDTADAQAVERHLPWTTVLRPKDVVWRGTTAQLTSIVDTEREGLVLKKGRSLGGQDVLLGWCTPKSEWDSKVRAVIDSGEWVVQQRCTSVRFPMQTGETGYAPNDVIWGPYTLGDTCGSVFVRAQPSSIQGVLNTAFAAVDGVLFEVDE